MSLKSSSFSSGRLLLYLAVVVVLNLAVASVPSLRLDLTPRKFFTLSPVSRAMLANLEQPLTVRAYLSDNLPARYNTIGASLKDLLLIYAQAGNKNFNFKINTISSGEEGQQLRDEAQSYGINQVNIQAFEKNEFKQVAVYLGLVIIQEDSVEKIDILSPTANLEYEVTAAILRMSRRGTAFKQLAQPLQVQLYLSPALTELNPEWDTLADSYRALIEDELAPQFYDQLSYQQIDPDRPPAGLPTGAELKLASLEVSRDGGSQPVYASIVLKNGDTVRDFNLMQKVLNLNSLFGGNQSYNVSLLAPAEVKEALGQRVEQMVGINQKISYVQDLGNPPLFASPYQQPQPGQLVLGQFQRMVGASYDLEAVDIADGVPGATNVMLLVDPSEKLNAWQLYQLDQYLMYGGALMLAVSPYRTVSLQQYGGQSATVPNVNLIPGKDGEYTLADLLTHYGVGVKNAMVFDQQSYINRTNQGGNYNEQQIYYLLELRNENFNPDQAYLNGLQFAIFEQGAPLEVEQSVATPLLWSSDKAWTKELGLQDNPLSVFPPADSELKRYPLIALREGMVTSFFADKERPERPQPEPAAEEDSQEASKEPEEISQLAERPFLDQTEQLALLVAGSARLLDDNLLRQLPDNATLATNLINVISGNEEVANLRAKGQTVSYLNQDLSNQSKQAVILVNMIGLPVLVLVIGLLVYASWKNRRRRIAAMFAHS